MLVLIKSTFFKFAFVNKLDLNIYLLFHIKALSNLFLQNNFIK